MTGLLAIDTGVRELGWALWKFSGRGPTRDRPPVPTSCGVEKIDASVDWERAASALVVGLPWEQADSVVAEWPSNFGGPVGLATSARGDTLKLAFACGLYKCCAAKWSAEFRLAPVFEWKGQLKKRVVETRVRRMVGDRAASGEPFESHAWDAVGIGLWAMGYF